ncbi:HAMP domain-containing sensor histidine kinase [Porphyromonas endodontalis]|jgi:sensor histidine kinase|uniref:sensor histidine kinase n=1 Tax=Porphyromonas endodontalis TaxID=28124 RepID=UPI0028E990C9|nr:HAMP domain-containing sensor histidine kinase [Porphyromonas endodontalis]
MKHYSLSLNILLALLAIAVATLPVVLSQQLHRKMVADERAKMELWAEATEGLASDSEENALNLMLHIIQSNETIPILLVTDRDSIVSFNNITIPEGRDTSVFLSRYLAQARGGYPPIAIDLGAEGYQYLYYSDSSTLESLTLFPWLQGVVFILFVGIVIIAAVWAKRNAQNRLWVGLSKETAHQLGTPISSLLAWLELLRAEGIAEESLVEMDKDVERLQTIAHRFQKIGSEPHFERCDLAEEVATSARYISTRISRGVTLFYDFPSEPLPVMLIPALWSWVIENLVKNAVDAMQGKGEITIAIERRGHVALIDITDTGRGIAPRHRRRVFNPGFTTKSRGWGLGLSLARRIVETYHHGRITLLRSEVGIGTTFRIKIPLND